MTLPRRHAAAISESSHRLSVYRMMTGILCAIAAIWCLTANAYAELSPGPESRYMAAIRKNIERSVADKSCVNHNDCGAAVLINRQGCRMYTPFSFLSTDERKIQTLLQAYNGMALRARRDAGMTQGCSRNISEPDTICNRNRLQSRGVCTFKNS